MKKSCLESVRKYLHSRSLQALLVTHTDAHSSEYIARQDERLEFVSNFSGSNGYALITQDKALLWTDGRYFTQASKQLGEGWELMKMGEKNVPTLEAFLGKLAATSTTTNEEDRILYNKRERSSFILGVESEYVSIAFCDRIQETNENISIELIYPSIINQIWEDEFNTRPKATQVKISSLPVSVTGKSVEEKLQEVYKEINAKKCDALAISALDDIAWLLNCRGENEIPFNPVFFAHLLVTVQPTSTCTVYTDHSLPKMNGVNQKPYKQFYQDVFDLFQNSVNSTKVWIDHRTTSCAFLQNCLPSTSCYFKESYSQMKKKFHLGNTCVKLQKPKKTEQEKQAMIRAQISDGVALCKFLALLDATTTTCLEEEDECTLSDKLEKFRQEEDEFYVGKSFDTISSFAENGAIVHYKPKPEDCKKIIGSNVYLVDSGGHYSYGGTTDTTRTVWIGECDKSNLLYLEAKRCYTEVLKGHIQLSCAKFPVETLPSHLDVIPRASMWKGQLSYSHGSGHGVGCWLCVHELPPLMSLSDAGQGGISPGMCITNEPGYYLEGKFGFRIENLMFCIPTPPPATSSSSTSSSSFCEFETITYVPYCKKLIDEKMLTQEEIQYLNSYHQLCRQMISSRLVKNENVMNWFMKETERIG